KSRRESAAFQDSHTVHVDWDYLDLLTIEYLRCPPLPVSSIGHVFLKAAEKLTLNIRGEYIHCGDLPRLSSSGPSPTGPLFTWKRVFTHFWRSGNFALANDLVARNLQE